MNSRLLDRIKLEMGDEYNGCSRMSGASYCRFHDEWDDEYDVCSHVRNLVRAGWNEAYYRLAESMFNENLKVTEVLSELSPTDRQHTRASGYVDGLQYARGIAERRFISVTYD